MRKIPAVAYVTRYWCETRHTSFGLLPDFYASRMPGTLDMIEEAAAKAEDAALEKVADEMRPGNTPDAVTIATAIVWVRLRVALARAILTTVRGLIPDRFADLPPRVSAFRRRLETLRVLVALREIVEPYLHRLPAPLGLVPRPALDVESARARPQRPGPDPPVRAR